MNAPELLKKELLNFEKRFKTKNFGTVFFDSVTDPYVRIETKYLLTRKCLEVLADFGYEGNIFIMHEKQKSKDVSWKNLIES